jgi:hypothetical protein
MLKRKGGNDILGMIPSKSTMESSKFKIRPRKWLDMGNVVGREIRLSNKDKDCLDP